MPHVFDMFRQADPSPTRDVSGMGLGLNLVKQFVELQGGTVTAHSDGEGTGATFTCRFPIYRPAVTEARAG
jgi:signal transduction histidine kinase